MSRSLLPEARAEGTSYENIETTCPNCGSYCVLNRTSDLRTHMPVAGKETLCPVCGMPFRLLGDTVNAGYEAILYEAAHLLRRSHYMLSVVRACQAYEMLFALYLRVELVYKPFGRECQTEPWPSLECLNALNKALRRKVEKRAFSQLRARFLRQVIGASPPPNLEGAKDAIESLRSRQSWEDPKRVEIESASICETLKPLLIRLAKTNVHELRNRVVHERGYRPSREEAGYAVKEASSLLFALGWELDLREDVNWYTSCVTRDDKSRPLLPVEAKAR